MYQRWQNITVYQYTKRLNRQGYTEIRPDQGGRRWKDIEASRE